MRHCARLALLLAVTWTSTAAAQDPAAAADHTDDQVFTSLFDGETLTGWHGNGLYWSVQDGAIFGQTDGNIPANTFLITANEYSDFELRIKWKLHGHKGNSGVQFRSVEYNASADLPPYVVGGYQADIADNQFLGILYGERTSRGVIQDLTEAQKAEVAAAVKQDDWNEYVITAHGDHVTQVLNGVTTVDIVDPEGPKSGIIALQLHSGQNMSISFKDIAIRPLH
jgi:hypothetical protein